MDALVLCYFKRLGVSLLSANSLLERYVYPTSKPRGAASISSATKTADIYMPYPSFEFRERSCIVPPGVVSLLRT